MIKDWLKHAFAVDRPGPASPNDAERTVVDRVLTEVVRRRLAIPALMFLEMSRSMNYLGAQVLHYFAPFVTVLVDTQSYDVFANFLERRGSVDYMCQRLEELGEKAGEKAS